MEKTYIYETHLHTSTSSACGHSTGDAYISLYQELGYSGIIVTDHFFNGNCAVPHNLPWEDRVHLFCKGYQDAKAEGDRHNFPVFFGWECHFDGDEYLVYGLDEEWLLAHPEMMEWDQATHYQKIKEAGGLVIQAHPFRERGYLTKVNVHPFQCDGFEIANAGNPSEQDQLAYRYAKTHHIRMTAGSDIHLAKNSGSMGHFGVSFDTPLSSIQDYVRLVLAGQGTPYVPEEKIAWMEGSSNHLPLYLYDEKNQPRKIETLEELW